jgi:hypothetical protein
MLTSIIRPMTLTVLRQIDPPRKVLLIKYLYESKMLRTDFGDLRVDLTDADLNGIQLNQIQMRNLSLSGSSMINASFISTDLIRADLTNSLFINTDLSEVNFYRTCLIHSQFNNSMLLYSDMALADLTRSIINEQQFSFTSSYNMAKMPNGSEALNASLIDFESKCSLLRWTIYPRNSINLTNDCYFISLKDNVTIIYRIPMYSYKRLFEQQEALLHFRFQGKIENLRIDFIYQDQYSIEIIHQVKQWEHTSNLLFNMKYLLDIHVMLIHWI